MTATSEAREYLAGIENSTCSVRFPYLKQDMVWARGQFRLDTVAHFRYMLKLRFEWDPRKAEENSAKHGVSFEEAITAFDDPWALVADDPLHSSFDEVRRWLIGKGDRSVLVVVFTVRESGSVYRIISAWRAGRRERQRYEQARQLSI